MVEKKSISFREEIFKLIEKRGESHFLSRSEVVNQGLGRYYKLIFAAQLAVFEKFTDDELMAIFAACNGTLFSEMREGLLYTQVAEAHEYGELAGCVGYDINVLLPKLLEVSDVEQVATIELAERFWTEVGKGRLFSLSVKELKDEEIQLYRGILRFT